MKGQKRTDAAVLVQCAIAGIEAGKLEIRPGSPTFSRQLSRIAPQFMLKQMTKMMRTEAA